MPGGRGFEAILQLPVTHMKANSVRLRNLKFLFHAYKIAVLNPVVSQDKLPDSAF